MRNKFIVLFTAIFILFSLAVFSSAADTSSRPVQDSVDRITPKALKAILDKGSPVIVVDVRSSKAYTKQHITGAISVPLNMVESSPEKLPLDRKIIFY